MKPQVYKVVNRFEDRGTIKLTFYSDGEGGEFQLSLPNIASADRDKVPRERFNIDDFPLGASFVLQPFSK